MAVSSSSTVLDTTTAWLDRLCGWLAATLPWAISLGHLSPASQWRDDVALVRGLGILPLGTEGFVSTVVTQLTLLVPLGSRVHRAAMASALGASALGLVTYLLVRDLLSRNADTPRLARALALAAALVTALGTTGQLEGTVAGGATWAVALVVSTLLVDGRLLGATKSSAHLWFWGIALGVLLGLTVLERHLAGLLALGALLTQRVFARHPWESKLVRGAAVALVATLALGLLPQWIRVPPPGSSLAQGLFFNLPFAGLRSPSAHPTAPGDWMREAGMLPLSLAAVGWTFGTFRRTSRPLVLALTLFVILDFLFGAPGDPASFSAAPLLRLAALACFSVLSVLGLQSVVILASVRQKTYAPALGVLMVVLEATLVMVTIDDASYRSDRHQWYGTDRWTDEASAALPTGGLLLIRHQPLALRLWAARLARGQRPDLVVVPTDLLDDARTTAPLLTLEPALSGLIRELAINGQPTEYVLSSLADARRLFLEFDPSWDHRLRDHALPRPMWTELRAQSLGRSDRRLATDVQRHGIERLIADINARLPRDQATLNVIELRLREQLCLLAYLGDRGSLPSILDDYRSLDRDDPWLKLFDKRLEAKPRGSIDVSGLFE